MGLTVSKKSARCATTSESRRRARGLVATGPDDRVFVNHEGGSMLRSNFQRQVWRPSLVHAGLLGQVIALGEEQSPTIRDNADRP